MTPSTESFLFFCFFFAVVDLGHTYGGSTYNIPPWYNTEKSNRSHTQTQNIHRIRKKGSKKPIIKVHNSIRNAQQDEIKEKPKKKHNIDIRSINLNFSIPSCTHL